MEVKDTVYRDYKRRIDEAHEKLVWNHPGTENWYRNSKGRVVAITPWRNDAFWRMTRKPSARTSRSAARRTKVATESRRAKRGEWS